MPELPEVETMRRGILKVCAGRVDRVFRYPCRKRPIQVTPTTATINRRLSGRRIELVERLGKRVVLVFDDQQRLVFEPRMTGLVLLGDPPTREHLRLGLAIRLEGRGGPRECELRFWDRRGLGSITLFHGDEFAERFHSGRVGPDALQVTPGELRARFEGSTAPLKVALLDQKRLAGVGNLYASEILHRVGIDPRTPCRNLTAPQWRSVHREMLKVLRAAIRLEGSTLADGTYRNALNQTGSYQNHHRVYDRAGELCPSCRKGIIQRIVQAQRATFFCPVCQGGRVEAEG